MDRVEINGWAPCIDDQLSMFVDCNKYEGNLGADADTEYYPGL